MCISSLCGLISFSLPRPTPSSHLGSIPCWHIVNKKCWKGCREPIPPETAVKDRDGREQKNFQSNRSWVQRYGLAIQCYIATISTNCPWINSHIVIFKDHSIPFCFLKYYMLRKCINNFLLYYEDKHKGWSAYGHASSNEELG